MDTHDHAAPAPAPLAAPSDCSGDLVEARENGMPYDSSQASEVGNELPEGSILMEAHLARLPEGSVSATPPLDLADKGADLMESNNQAASDAVRSETVVAENDDTATVEVVGNQVGAMANGDDALQKEAIETEIKWKNEEPQVQDITQRPVQADESIVRKEKMRDEKSQGDSLLPEIDTIQVPQHWHFKPSVHVTIIGGEVNEEDMVSIFGSYGTISSISFESERRDSAIIRYDFSAGDADKLVGQVREALNNTKVGDGTLIVEHFRSDSLLFVGNLTPDIEDALLLKMFEPHGRVERAFVLRNSEGQSKGYGFVEYSLRGQASAAKVTMGNINMDGRVLRVEWSDCRKVADMFSTVLFIDRIPRENPNVEQSLRNLFGQYGKVRDCYLAVGIHQQFRGFAFIEFTHSLFADRAHHALDGHVLDGCSIRVSFGNPSKSVQSYKVRSGPTGPAQFGPGHFKKGAPDHSSQLEAPGMLLGGPLKGSMGIPYLGSRYMAPVRPGMVGMGIGMQFGRGQFERSLVPPMLGSGAGMLGPGSVAAGVMGRSPLMVGNMSSRPYMGTLQLGGSGFQGPKASTSSTGVTQVANTQVKAHEEEAKARAEALKQSIQKVASQQQAANQFRFNVAQQNFYQQHIQDSTDQHQRQTDSTPPYQQAYQQPSQQTTLQTQYQGWGQQQQPQAYGMHYYSQPTQNYSQLQETPQQYVQQDGYYQQSIPQVQPAATQQQYAYVQQYNTQYGQQYNQQTSQSYSQAYSQAPQGSEPQYQQPSHQPQQQASYQQYADQYSVQVTHDQTQVTGASEGNVSVAVPVSQDMSQQQQAYAAYYQQQAQIQSGTTATTGTVNQQQSYEAQWAAYYANQAAYQQQASSYGQQQSYAAASAAATLYAQGSTTDTTSQKRTAEQMESSSQTQAVAYNYTQLVPSVSGDMQQAYPGMATYQQQPAASAMAYQQQVVANYQQPAIAPPYQQATLASAYQQAAATNPTVGYDQTGQFVTDGYQQQPTSAAGAYQTAIPGQITVANMNQ